MNEEYQYTGEELRFGTLLVAGASPEIGAKKKAPSRLQWCFSGEGRRLQAFRREEDELATSPGRRVAAQVTETRLEVKQLGRAQ